MRIIVTGGAGFIGSHVADAAVARGHEVWVVDDLSSGKRENLPAAAHFAQLDIRDAAGLTQLFQEVRPDVISHQAAQISVSASTREPGRDAEVNLIGGLNVAMAAVSAKAKRLVFASTGGAMYGEIPDGERADESHAKVPLSPYGCSKLAFEGYLPYFAHAYGLGTTVLRYANVYGPRQDPHGEAGVVAIFAQRLRDREPLQINARAKLGDDGCVRDYVFVKDVVAANLAAIEGKVERGVMNVGTGLATTTRQLIEGLQVVLGAPVEVKAAPSRAGDVQRSVLDATYCASVIGPATSLADGLAETARWFQTRK
ncbi:MAG TPA: NAD-dependent epimerase/dehydratase family protein [Polyangiales bacterium]